MKKWWKVFLSSISHPSDFLKVLSRNVQTTWRLTRQQLSAHSARNQEMPSDTNCKSSQKTGATTGPLSRRCDSTAHVRICNKLHEVHSSKLISITHHVTTIHKLLLWTSDTENNYSQCTISDPENGRHLWPAAAKTKWWQGHIQQGWLQPNCLL